MSAPAMVAALAIDRVAGEPPTAAHPVVWFGRAMGAVESQLYAPTVLNGAGYAAVGVGAAATTGVALRRLVGPVPAAVLCGSVAIAGRMLEREVAAVAHALTAHDIGAARVQISRLVGRATDEMTEPDIARAAVESLAENSVDAVAASIFWGTVAGAPGVLAHRAINTMDAMVGHRNERYQRFGTASARLDDVANWIPARLFAAAVAIVSPSRARAIFDTIRRDAPQHPSPNGGVAEASVAAALNITLGGINRYGDAIEDRGELGDGPAPSASDVDRAIRLARRATTVVALGAVAAQVGFQRLRGRVR